MLAAAKWAQRLPQRHLRAFATNPPKCLSHSLTLLERRPLSRPLSKRLSRSLPPRRTASNLPQNEKSKQQQAAPVDNDTLSKALARLRDIENDLVTPVHVPEDASGVLQLTHPAMQLLKNSSIIIQRQLEMMNVLVGFEQANRYIIMDPHGNHIGYMAEQDHGFGKAMTRQLARTRRSFTAHVFDKEQREILRIHRPFSWISSWIYIYDAFESKAAPSQPSIEQDGSPAMEAGTVSTITESERRLIGTAKQEWALLRRKYDLFLAKQQDRLPALIHETQSPADAISKEMEVVKSAEGETGLRHFAYVDEPALSWDFGLKSYDGGRFGSVSRNFSGFGRELFTDTGTYALRMDAAAVPAVPETDVEIQEGTKGMTLDQRAVMLATAVCIDFDYFSRHSGIGGGFMPLWLPWGGGGAAAVEAGAVTGAEEAGLASGAGAVARQAGVGEGAAVGAGTMAGYEAMQHARGGSQQAPDPQSPQSYEPYHNTPQEQQSPGEGEEVWGQSQGPWSRDGKAGKDGLDNSDDHWSGYGGDGGEGGGGGDGGSWLDMFFE